MFTVKFIKDSQRFDLKPYNFQHYTLAVIIEPKKAGIPLWFFQNYIF